MLYNNIEELIGNTPILKISGEKYGLRDADIYMKLEYLNPFSSIKDRTALGLTKHVDMNTLGEERNILESSSGNTAKALQLLASRHGSRLTSVTNRIKIPETEQLLRYLGAEIVALPGKSICPDPNDAGNPLHVIDGMLQAEPNRYIHTDQYQNHDNTQMHADTTAKELYDELGEIDVFVSGVGTGGSSGGVIEYANTHGKTTTFVGVIADPSDFLPGIRTRAELFETALFNADMYSELRDVTSKDALIALRQLVQQEGVLAGPTTGANFAAALAYAKATEQPDRANKRAIACIACDRLEGYMSYISKRQPELFNRQQHTDIYNVTVDDTLRAELEKPTDEVTATWLQTANVQVIDTRGVKPFTNFHIAGSVNYPEEYLREMLESGTPVARTSPVLVVCPMGDRSVLIAAVLRQRGIEAYSLAGGLMAWRQARLGFERKQ